MKKIRIRMDYIEEHNYENGIVKGTEHRFDLTEFVGQPEEFKRKLERVRRLFQEKVDEVMNDFERDALEELEEMRV